jgi:hypothetical protein
MESYKEEKIILWSEKMRFLNHLPQMNSEKNWVQDFLKEKILL